jgi:putative phosphoesterase
MTVRVAAFYDVHGNLPALEAVLAELEEVDVDRIVVGGDVVHGAFPRESVAKLRALGGRALWVRGNCDRTPNAFDVERLSDEQRAFLAGLPLTLSLEVDGLGPVLFFHATPRSDEEVFTRYTPEERLEPMLAGIAEEVLVCGHTHVQVDRRAAGKRVVCAGSVGMPYADEPGAYWTLLGPDVEFRRTPYDLESAAERIRSSGWPDAEEFVRENLLEVPDGDEASRYFEELATRSG